MSETVQIARTILLLDEAVEFLKDDNSDAARDLAARALAMSRILRNYTEDAEQLIRSCAARGMGKQDTMETLGLSRYRFQLLTSVMPDIEWVSPNRTSGRRRHYDSLRGVPKKPGHNRPAVEASKEALRKHSICGIRGTSQELFDLWRDYCSVGYSTVNRRLAQGESVYDAFFGKRQPSARGRKTTKAQRQAFGRSVG